MKIHEILCWNQVHPEIIISNYISSMKCNSFAIFIFLKKVTQIKFSKCDSLMKFHWWNLMDKKLNEKINFHGIEFIYEIMVSIQYIPWTSICVVFNDKANIRLHTETKKTRVLLGRFSTHYWLSFKIQLHWRTPLNIERIPPQPSKETWSQKWR